MPRFKHNPLASPKKEIRLLMLDLCGDPDEIRCNLSTHVLKSRPRYHALSYEWGEPEPLVAIMVNDGEMFYARHNLWLFLHRCKLVSQKMSPQSSVLIPLWIDAICVDQTNTVERNAQVQLMGYIYREALSVIVWLGWSDNLDPAVTATLRREVSSDLEYGAQACLSLFTYAAVDLDRNDTVPDEATPQQICEFVAKICENTYWTRRWIIQEILLARTVLLVFGEQELPWGSICMMFHQYQKHNRDDLGLWSVESLSNLHYLQKSILYNTAAQVWQHQLQRKQDNKIEPLESLLQKYRTLQCEDFHDKVYAFADLATDDLFDLEYSITPAELFSRVLTATLRNKQAENKLRSYDSWRALAHNVGFKLPDDFNPLQASLLADSQLIELTKITPVTLRAAKNFRIISVIAWIDFTLGLNTLDFRRRIWSSVAALKNSRTNSIVVNGVNAYPHHSDIENNLKRHRQNDIIEDLCNQLCVREAYESLCSFSRSSVKVLRKDPVATYAETCKHHPHYEEKQDLAKKSNDRQKDYKVMIFEDAMYPRFAVTHADAEVGDIACRFDGSNCLILRCSTSGFRVMGLGWVSSLDVKPESLIEVFRKAGESIKTPQRPEDSLDEIKHKGDLASKFESILDFVEEYETVYERREPQDLRVEVEMEFEFWEFVQLILRRYRIDESKAATATRGSLHLGPYDYRSY